MHSFINLLPHFVDIFLVIGMVIETIIKIKRCKSILLRRILATFTGVASIHDFINFAPDELFDAGQQFHFGIEVFILET